MKKAILYALDIVALLLFPIGALSVAGYYRSRRHIVEVSGSPADPGGFTLTEPTFPVDLVCGMILGGILLQLVVFCLTYRWRESTGYDPLLVRLRLAPLRHRWRDGGGSRQKQHSRFDQGV